MKGNVMDMNWYVASDYAGIKAEGFEAYYGYEVTIEEADGCEEWCFAAKFNGQCKKIPFSGLPGKPKQFDVVDCLLAGLTLLHDQFDMVPKIPLDSPRPGA